jgi:hypothetical protein
LQPGAQTDGANEDNPFKPCKEERGQQQDAQGQQGDEWSAPELCAQQRLEILECKTLDQEQGSE